MGQKLTRVGTCSQITMFFRVFFFGLHIKISHHSVIISRLFVCHLCSLWFQFLIGRKAGQARGRTTTHALLQTDNLGLCKVIFLALSAVIQPGLKISPGSCKEAHTDRKSILNTNSWERRGGGVSELVWRHSAKISSSSDRLFR